jgi:hypothetical protein
LRAIKAVDDIAHYALSECHGGRDGVQPIRREAKMNDHKRVEIEKRIAKQVVADALAAGFTISVNDGEEITLTRSSDKAAIVAAMFSTDHDYLIINRASGERIGWIMLVYGNGTDLISDYVVKPEIEAVIKRASETADKLAA